MRVSFKRQGLNVNSKRGTLLNAIDKVLLKSQRNKDQGIDSPDKVGIRLTIFKIDSYNLNNN